MPTTSQIKLPVQILNWSLIKNLGNLKKIVFQFEIKAAGNGNKTFQLIAYPVYRDDNRRKHKSVSLEIKRTRKAHFLKLPLTLANLELDYRDMMRKLNINKKSKLEFTPRLYKNNPHAGYDVSDGINSVTVNPSPPAKPGFN